MDDSSTAGRHTGPTPRRTFAEVLGPAGLERVRAAARARSLRAGEVLCHEGEEGGGAYVVADGLVALTKLSLNGRQVLIELRGAGELVGELNAIDGGRRSATVRAVEAGTVWALGSAELMRLARTDGDVAAALLVTLSAKVRESAARHLELGTTEALPRVARRVAELADLRGGGREVASPLSQQELADWAGVSRDGVVRSLTWLRQEGVVETGRRRFVILDPTRLRALADDT
jgi:CRP-like cAMP-binding protein